VPERNSERSLALAGVVAIVIIVISAVLPGSPPKPDDSVTKIADFLVDKSDQIRIAGYLGAVAIVPFFFFLGALWRLLRRGEGGSPFLAVMAAAGGVFASVVGALGGIVLAVLPLVRTSLTVGSLRTLYVLATNIAFTSLFGIATLALSASAVFLRSRVMPAWLGYLGVLAGLVALVGARATVSTNDTLFTIGFIGFLLATLWILLLSILMLRAAPEPAPA